LIKHSEEKPNEIEDKEFNYRPINIEDHSINQKSANIFVPIDSKIWIVAPLKG
jgi:hypothetical protein